MHINKSQGFFAQCQLFIKNKWILQDYSLFIGSLFKISSDIVVSSSAFIHASAYSKLMLINIQDFPVHLVSSCFILNSKIFSHLKYRLWFTTLLYDETGDFFPLDFEILA